MNLNNGELNAKAELMLMGKVVAVVPEEVEYLTKYVVNTLVNCKQIYGDVDEKVQEYMRDITRYHKNNVEWMCINTFSIWGDRMLHITYVYKEGRKKLDTANGRIAYVINCTAPDCSQMGYCFFEKRGDEYHRVG